ncbi:MAG: hypothetical protein HBSAPP03_27130 [Phycisphaerae bacterium]|nr:MAG: hypothetical protein HBSAPP03_27130 [Phycisphaerae bacterium]
MLAACLGSLPWTLTRVDGVPRYNAGDTAAGRLPPRWITPTADQARRAELTGLGGTWLGTDALGRSLAVRMLLGGTISLAVGLAAAALAVVIGTLVGVTAGYLGGRTDALLMRLVDVLFGLPYVLVVVLFAVAGDALVAEYASRERARAVWVREHARDGLDPETLHAPALAALPPRPIGEGTRTALDLGVMLLAIGGTGWLSMARVIRGEVLSLKNHPFIEAARSIGVPPGRLLARHLLPNLAGTIVVYATLTVPQAMLQEAFLSFLGIGVKPPLPSWGRLAAEGLGEINPYQSNWWLLAAPCAALAVTLLALNLVGEGLREHLDPRSRRS